jgi:hypothetical protein
MAIERQRDNLAKGDNNEFGIKGLDQLETRRCENPVRIPPIARKTELQ